MDRRTIEVYEREADRWAARRPAVGAEAATAFAVTRLRTAPGDGRPVLDVGCGPGPHLVALGAGAIGLDATGAMLRLAAVNAPHTPLVRADLEQLPFAPRSLGGAWASKSYVHLPRHRLPLALAELHGALRVGAPVHLHVFAGDLEHGPLDGDDFPGRSFSLWAADHLADVVVGAGFTVDDLTAATDDRGNVSIRVDATRARTLADTVAPGMRLLVCGLNPSLYAADAGLAYARPGNRFWPAALAAGLVTRDRDARHALVTDGVGITDLVKRATVGAAELTPEEYRAGLARVERLCAWLRPGAICFVGLAGWRAAVDRRAGPGPHPRLVGGVPAYVMPSTSGLNAHSSLDDLAAHLAEAAALADTPPRT